MSINLKEATEFMLTNGYILDVGKGKYKLSTKFHTDYRQQSVKRLESAMLYVTSELLSTASQPGRKFNWELHYKQFILDAKVPRRIDDGRGSSYQANAYSEAGMKAFRKALESGVDLGMLVKSTILYYAGVTRYKQAIGTYMEKGTWKTSYDELVAAANGGEQTLIDHIKTETKDEQQSSYRLG